MIHTMLHGELAASISDNVFLLARRPSAQLGPAAPPPATWRSVPVIAVAVAVIAWTVLRNQASR